MALGGLRAIAARMADEVDALTQATGLVDCLVRQQDGRLVGHSTERKAFCRQIQSLGLDTGAASRTGLVVGAGADTAVAVAALRELGFGRILCARGPEAQQSGTFEVVLDNTGGGELGMDLSHDHGAALRVETASGGLAALWNEQRASGAEGPIDLRILPGDAILEVNSKGGDVASLVAELSRHQVLMIKFSRGPCKDDSATMSESVEDLADLGQLTSLDVVVLSGGYESIAGGQWLLSTISRLKPAVLENAWPPAPAGQPNQRSFFEQLRAADCVVVETADLFFEQACLCLELWTGSSGIDAVRPIVARRIVRELAMPDSPREASLALMGMATSPKASHAN